MPECQPPYLRLVKTPAEKKDPPAKKSPIKKIKDYLDWRGLDLKTIMIGSSALCVILCVCILGILGLVLSLLS